MKPLHAAFRSNAGIPPSPSRRWIRHAVDGKRVSGVTVVTTRASIRGFPAISRARSAALVPISEVVSPATAWWRSRMPVRSMIQVSEVSTIRSRSALLRMPSGRWAATERIPARRSRAAVRVDATVAGRVAISCLEARVRRRGYGPGHVETTPGGGHGRAGNVHGDARGVRRSAPLGVPSRPGQPDRSDRWGGLLAFHLRQLRLTRLERIGGPVTSTPARIRAVPERCPGRPGWRAWPSAGGPRSRSTPPS